jgi:transposase-like protein
MLRASDESAWARVTPFFNYPADIRRAIYTTNNFTILWPERMPALERIAQ